MTQREGGAKKFQGEQMPPISRAYALGQGCTTFCYYRLHYSFKVRPPVNLILLDFRKFFKK